MSKDFMRKVKQTLDGRLTEFKKQHGENPEKAAAEMNRRFLAENIHCDECGVKPIAQVQMMDQTPVVIVTGKCEHIQDEVDQIQKESGRSIHTRFPS